MSDLKAGDKVIYTGPTDPAVLTKGNVYIVSRLYQDGSGPRVGIKSDDRGKQNGYHAKYFKKYTGNKLSVEEENEARLEQLRKLKPGDTVKYDPPENLIHVRLDTDLIPGKTYTVGGPYFKPVTDIKSTLGIEADRFGKPNGHYAIYFKPSKIGWTNFLNKLTGK